jgi:hypothetical protein
MQSHYLMGTLCILVCFDMYVEGVSIHLKLFAHKKDINEMCISFGLLGQIDQTGGILFS